MQLLTLVPYIKCQADAFPYARLFNDLVTEARLCSADEVAKLPVDDILQRCRNAELGVLHFAIAVPTWELPCSIPEKASAAVELLVELKTAAAEVCEYIDHINNKILAKVKKNAAEKKKQWRNARSSIVTSLQGRSVPNTLAKMVGWQAHNYTLPSVDAGIDSTLCAATLSQAVACEDSTNPFNVAFMFGGGLAAKIQVPLMIADKVAITAKAQELVNYLISNKRGHAFSTIDATAKVDWTSDGLDKLLEVTNKGESTYNKHILFLTEVGKFEPLPTATCFSYMPVAITVVRGLASVVVLSQADIDTLGTDLVSGIKGLSGNQFETGAMGRTFTLKEGETVWCPYGSYPILTGICTKWEENRFKKLVLSWPVQSAVASTKRTIDDFTVCVFEPVLDTGAVGFNASLKSKMAGQFLTVNDILPKSFSNSAAYAAFKTSLGL